MPTTFCPVMLDQWNMCCGRVEGNNTICHNCRRNSHIMQKCAAPAKYHDRIACDKPVFQIEVSPFCYDWCESCSKDATEARDSGEIEQFMWYTLQRDLWMNYPDRGYSEIQAVIQRFRQQNPGLNPYGDFVYDQVNGPWMGFTTFFYDWLETNACFETMDFSHIRKVNDDGIDTDLVKKLNSMKDLCEVVWDEWGFEGVSWNRLGENKRSSIIIGKCSKKCKCVVWMARFNVESVKDDFLFHFPGSKQADEKCAYNVYTQILGTSSSVKKTTVTYTYPENDSAKHLHRPAVFLERFLKMESAFDLLDISPNEFECKSVVDYCLGSYPSWSEVVVEYAKMGSMDAKKLENYKKREIEKLVTLRNGEYQKRRFLTLQESPEILKNQMCSCTIFRKPHSKWDCVGKIRDHKEKSNTFYRRILRHVLKGHGSDRMPCELGMGPDLVKKIKGAKKELCSMKCDVTKKSVWECVELQMKRVKTKVKCPCHDVPYEHLKNECSDISWHV